MNKTVIFSLLGATVVGGMPLIYKGDMVSKLFVVQQ